jgi:thiamine biosynthesis protein ThiS
MILVNNRDKIEWEEGMTVTRLLEVCRFTARQITVWVNGELVSRDAHATHPIRDHDEVRVLHFIGGG